jgi:DNA replication protein DnaC
MGAFTPPATASRGATGPAGRTLRQKRHGLLCGPTGVGNSPLAPALAPEACRQGLDGLFVNPHTRLQPLHGGRAEGTWMQRWRGERRPALLV